ncbi:MAG: alpha/beta hydrolase [Jatrophihabitans sp.]
MHSVVTTEPPAAGSRATIGALTRQWSAAAAAAVRRRPPVVTAALIVCIVATYLRLEVGGRLPMLSYDEHAFSPRGLVQGQFVKLVESTILTNYPWMVVSISGSLLVTLGTYEVLAGHIRAAVLAVIGAVLGPVAVTAGLGVLVALGSSWADARLGTLDIGASAIIAMSSGAVAGRVRSRWFTAGLVLFLLGGLLTHHRIADWEHLLVFGPGYLVGRFGGAARVRPARSTAQRMLAYVIPTAALLVAAVVASSWLLPSPPVLRNATGMVVSPARIVDTTYPSPALGGANRRVEVLLPPGYDSEHVRYPVVELLHGHPGKPDDLFALGDVQKSSADAGIAPFIAVVPDGTGPHIADSWYADVATQKMGTAVSVDLRDWVARMYRITDSWSYAGLSSGGFGAAYLPLVDPAPVHAVCGLSGDYTAAMTTILRHAPAGAQRKASPIDHLATAPHLVFLAYGRAESRTRDHAAVRYATALRRSHHDVVVRTYPGTHQWPVWRPAFRDCFRTILPSGR